MVLTKETDEQEEVPTNESNISLAPTEQTLVAPATEAAPSDVSIDHESLVNQAFSKYINGDEFKQVLTEKVDDAVKTHISSSTPSLAEAPASIPSPPPTKPDTTPVCPATLPRFLTFALYCNGCKGDIVGEHSHCETCDNGDFDLCNSCVEKGIHCKDERHWMIKRVFKDGQISSSSTMSYTAPSPRTEKKEGPTLVCNNCHTGLST